MTSYYSGGNTINLGAVLGQGGEGTVFSIQGDNNLAAKLYLPHLAAERRDKILDMVSAKLNVFAPFVAYPIDAIFESGGRFSGFSMRIMAGRKPAHQLYSPAGRKIAFPKATYPMLVRATANIAKAVHNVHSTKCVIGDINHSGFLVSSDATVVLIDSDSFQFSFKGVTYPCRVGVPEFTPPELQGKDLSKSIRTSNHDNFGLAILIFYTLMMGRHPFAGRYLGQGDMPMERAITEFRFAYSARRSATLTEPPPNVPTLADLPLGVSDGFERAFGPNGPAGARPSASEWISILEKVEGELIQCSVSPAHHYFRVAKGCPWCRMERAYPGFVAFVPVFPVHTGGNPLDLAQLISAIRATNDPGPAPDLAALMPAIGQTSKTKWAEMKRKRFRRWLAGVIGVGLALFLLVVAPAEPLFALMTAVASALIAFAPSFEVREELKKLKAAKEAWNDAKRYFEQNASNTYYLSLRNEAETLISRLQQLNSDEFIRLAELTKNKRELQLRRFLEQYHIDQARIKGVGDARKLTLKSYGIETAADINYHRIVLISGFGPATANALLDWRCKVEAKFQFNPNRSIDPADLSAIKTEFATKRVDAQVRASQTLAKLQRAAADAVSARSNPTAQAMDAWIALRHAQQFEQAFRPTPQEAAQLFSVAVVCFASLIVYSNLKNFRTVESTPETSSEITPGPSAPPPNAAPPKAVPPLSASGPSAPPLSESPSETSLGAAVPPSVIPHTPPLTIVAPKAFGLVPKSPDGQLLATVPVAPDITGSLPPPTGAGPSEAAPAFPRPVSPDSAPVSSLGRYSEPNDQTRADQGGMTTAPPTAAQPTGSPLQLTERPSDKASSAPLELSPIAPTIGTDSLNSSVVEPYELYERGAAAIVQQRLKALGYFDGDADGIWGPQSRAALKAFRRTQGFVGDDEWDAETQAALMSSSAPSAGSKPLTPDKKGETQFAGKYGAKRNPLNRTDALWAQRRLYEFGLLHTEPNGIWGIPSRNALQEFKSKRGFPPNDIWDGAAERALTSLQPESTQGPHGRQR